MASSPALWQVFVRQSASPAWRLVTPPGVADNGGLVAAGTGRALTVAVRPSQNLTFSPLAVSTDGGARWSTALVDANQRGSRNSAVRGWAASAGAGPGARAAEQADARAAERETLPRG